MRLTHVVVLALLVVPFVHAGSPPSVPLSPAGQTGAGVGEIDLTWTAPLSAGSSPVAGYRIYRSLTASGLTHLVDLGNTSAFTDTGIPDGAPRYYRISAVNGDGEGPLSAVVSAMAKSAPSVPRNVGAVPYGRGNISVNWTAPEFNGTEDILGYNVYRAASDTGPFGFHALVAATPHVDSGLGDNATFYYRVSALNVHGEGPLSGVFEGHSPRTPSVPVNLTLDFFPLMGNLLTWEPPLDEGGDEIVRYHIYRAVGTATEEQIGVMGRSPQSFTDRDCPLLAQCHYRIRARNGVGMSEYTPVVTGTGDQLPIIG